MIEHGMKLPDPVLTFKLSNGANISNAQRKLALSFCVDLKNGKITHMWRRWGKPQNFCLAFIDELEKQLFIKKTVEVGQ